MRRILLIIFLALLLLNTCCSYNHVKAPIEKFEDATVLIGKNTVYVYGALK